MHGLMSNTKWRKVLTVLAKYPVYLQLKRLQDEDFPLDVERTDLILSELGATHFTYVRCSVSYNEIDKLKVKRPARISAWGANEMTDLFSELSTELKTLGQLPCQFGTDTLVLFGYQQNVD